MLYIEEDGNLSPVQMMDKLDIGKGHKSDGDHEGPPTPSQVRALKHKSLYFLKPYILQVTYRGGLMGNTVGLVPTNGWITGLLSCFNWNIIGKGKAPQIEQSKFLQKWNSGQKTWNMVKNMESGVGQHFSWHVDQKE